MSSAQARDREQDVGFDYDDRERAGFAEHEQLAHQLARTGLLEEVCEELQAGLMQQWLATDPKDTATREQCYHEARSVDFVRMTLAARLSPAGHPAHAALVESAFSWERWARHMNQIWRRGDA